MWFEIYIKLNTRNKMPQTACTAARNKLCWTTHTSLQDTLSIKNNLSFLHTTWRKHPIVKWTHGWLFCSISLTYPCSRRKFFTCRCNNIVSGRHLGRTTANTSYYLTACIVLVLPRRHSLSKVNMSQRLWGAFSILVYSLVNQTVIRPLNYKCVSISLASASFSLFFRFLLLSATHANNTLHFAQKYIPSFKSFSCRTGDALLVALFLHVNILSILKVTISDLSLAFNFIQASCTYSNPVGKRFKISRAKSPEQKGHNVFVDWDLYKTES